MNIFGPLGDILDKTSGTIFHAATGTPNEAEKRKMNQAMNEQIRAYKEQSELARNEINAKVGEQVAEKRRIEEKQIRALRNKYRPTSNLLGGGPTTQPDMNSKLGG